MAFYETGAVIWDVIGPELEMMYETAQKVGKKMTVIRLDRLVPKPFRCQKVSICI